MIRTSRRCIEEWGIITSEQSLSQASAVSDALLPFTPHERQAGRLFSSAPCSAQQPVRDTDKFGCLVPIVAFLGVFDGVMDNAAFLVELEDKQASKFLMQRSRACNNVGDALKGFAYVPAVLLVCLAAGLPFDDQLLVAHMRGYRGSTSVLDHALRQDLEFHVANDRHSTPCDWRCP